MKEFTPVSFDWQACETQLEEFRQLLQHKPELKESRDIVPFFRKREQLAAFIGGRFPRMQNRDRLAYEYDLFGDFACDLVVGNSESRRYCFIEFEDATFDSMFQKIGKKATLEWPPRFEHGFSQIVDWFWKLDEMRGTPEYADRFGSSLVTVYGMLVVGRDENLSLKEQRRILWRGERVLVDSHQVDIVTVDELWNDMKIRLYENRRDEDY